MELIAENICKSIKRNMILDHINLQLSGAISMDLLASTVPVKRCCFAHFQG